MTRAKAKPTRFTQRELSVLAEALAFLGAGEWPQDNEPLTEKEADLQRAALDSALEKVNARRKLTGNDQ